MQRTGANSYTGNERGCGAPSPHLCARLSRFESARRSPRSTLPTGPILSALSPGTLPPVSLQYDTATVPILQMNFFNAPAREPTACFASHWLRVGLFVVASLSFFLPRPDAPLLAQAAPN